MNSLSTTSAQSKAALDNTLADRLIYSRKHLQAVSNEMTDLADMLCGTPPRPVDDKSGAMASGFLDLVSASADDVAEVADRISNDIARIRNRLLNT